MNATAKAAYTAGIIDGDGSICMVRVSTKTKDGQLSGPYWRISIRVDNCDRTLIEWLHENWNGHVLFNRDKGPNKRLQHIWGAVGNDVRCVINATLPYLIIKKEKAIWAREVLKIQETKRGRKNRYTEEFKAKLLEIHDRFVNDRKRIIATRNKKFIKKEY